MSEIGVVTTTGKDPGAQIKVVRAQRGFLTVGIQKALEEETLEGVRKQLEYALAQSAELGED